MGVFFGVPVMEGSRLEEITRVSGQWLSEWSDSLQSFVRYEQKEFEERLERWIEWGTGRLMAPVLLKKAGIEWGNRMLDLIEQDYGIKIEKVIGARPQLMDKILDTPDWRLCSNSCRI